MAARTDASLTRRYGVHPGTTLAVDLGPVLAAAAPSDRAVGHPNHRPDHPASALRRDRRPERRLPLHDARAPLVRCGAS